MTEVKPNRLSQRRYIPLDEAANYLGISIATVRRLISAGELTGYRIGKRLLRVDLNEVEEMVQVVPTIRTA